MQLAEREAKALERRRRDRGEHVALVLAGVRGHAHAGRRARARSGRWRARPRRGARASSTIASSRTRPLQRTHGFGVSPAAVPGEPRLDDAVAELRAQVEREVRQAELVRERPRAAHGLRRAAAALAVVPGVRPQLERDGDGALAAEHRRDGAVDAAAHRDEHAAGAALERRVGARGGPERPVQRVRRELGGVMPGRGESPPSSAAIAAGPMRAASSSVRALRERRGGARRRDREGAAARVEAGGAHAIALQRDRHARAGRRTRRRRPRRCGEPAISSPRRCGRSRCSASAIPASMARTPLCVRASRRARRRSCQAGGPMTDPHDDARSRDRARAAPPSRSSWLWRSRSARAPRRRRRRASPSAACPRSRAGSTPLGARWRPRRRLRLDVVLAPRDPGRPRGARRPPSRRPGSAAVPPLPERRRSSPPASARRPRASRPSRPTCAPQGLEPGALAAERALDPRVGDAAHASHAFARQPAALARARRPDRLRQHLRRRACRPRSTAPSPPCSASTTCPPPRPPSLIRARAVLHARRALADQPARHRPGRRASAATTPAPAAAVHDRPDRRTPTGSAASTASGDLGAGVTVALYELEP